MRGKIQLDLEWRRFIFLPTLAARYFRLLGSGTDFFHFAYRRADHFTTYLLSILHVRVISSIIISRAHNTSMADNNKDEKAKTSAAWTTDDETILIETLVKQKLAGNWGDNNPKKAAWTACEVALAGTDKPGAIPKNINTIKNRWQRVTYTVFEYMRISHLSL
jgi:hypothetical protein